MSIAFTRNGVAMTNQVVLNSDGIPGFTMAARHGEVGTGGLKIDDPAAALDVKGFDVIAAEESACAAPRIYTGFVTERPITRLDARGEDTREWDCDLVDLNTMLTWPRITGADGKRPAESDLARLTWLLGSGYMDDLSDELGGIVDTGFVNVTDNPILFGEADYRWKTPYDVLADLASVSGKTFFVRWDETAGQVGLFYDLAIAAVSQSTIRVSNDPADEDADTFAPQDEVTITRSPQDVASSVAYTYKGVTIFRTRAATTTEFGIRRELEYSTDRVGKAATAEYQAALFLENHSSEFDDLSFDLLLPAAKVNLLLEGDAVEVKFTHEPGYESFTWTRITRRVVAFETTGFYRVHYEASLGAMAGGGNGGGGAGFPWQPGACDTPALVNENQGVYAAPITFGFTPTEDNVLLLILAARNTGASSLSPPTGWFQVGYNHSFNPVGFQDAVVVYGKTSDGTETGVTATAGVWPNNDGGDWFIQEWSGIDLNDITVDDDNVGSGTTMTGESVVSTGGGLVLGVFVQSQDNTKTFTPAAGWTMVQQEGSDASHPDTIIVWDEATAATFTPEVGSNRTNGWRSITLLFACLPDANPPLPGQEVPPLPPASGDADGSNTDFTTEHPFSDGSLRVLHDGMDETSSIASYDGETGAFTLDYAPSAGSVIETYYQGR